MTSAPSILPVGLAASASTGTPSRLLAATARPHRDAFARALTAHGALGDASGTDWAEGAPSEGLGSAPAADTGVRSGPGDDRGPGATPALANTGSVIASPPVDAVDAVDALLPDDAPLSDRDVASPCPPRADGATIELRLDDDDDAPAPDAMPTADATGAAPPTPPAPPPTLLVPPPTTLLPATVPSVSDAFARAADSLAPPRPARGDAPVAAQATTSAPASAAEPRRGPTAHPRLVARAYGGAAGAHAHGSPPVATSAPAATSPARVDRRDATLPTSQPPEVTPDAPPSAARGATTPAAPDTAAHATSSVGRSARPTGLVVAAAPLLPATEPAPTSAAVPSRAANNVDDVGARSTGTRGDEGSLRALHPPPDVLIDESTEATARATASTASTDAGTHAPRRTSSSAPTAAPPGYHAMAQGGGEAPHDGASVRAPQAFVTAQPLAPLRPLEPAASVAPRATPAGTHRGGPPAPARIAEARDLDVVGERPRDRQAPASTPVASEPSAPRASVPAVAGPAPARDAATGGEPRPLAVDALVASAAATPQTVFAPGAAPTPSTASAAPASAPATLTRHAETSPAGTPGRMRLVLGDADARVVVDVAVRGDDVRVAFRSPDEHAAAALQRNGNVLAEAMRDHGLALAQLQATVETTGDAPERRRQRREPAPTTARGPRGPGFASALDLASTPPAQEP